MAYHPIFAVDAVGEEHPNGVDLAMRAMGHLLWALVDIDIDFLDAFPDTPFLYEAGVVYDRMQEQVDACGDDFWADIPHVLATGSVEKGIAPRGDCEDLCAWRVAELHVRYGLTQVTPMVMLQPGGDGIARPKHLYHVLVCWPETLPTGLRYPPTVARRGKYLVECPSTVLGMRARAA